MSLKKPALHTASRTLSRLLLHSITNISLPCRQYATDSRLLKKPPIYGQPLASTHAHLIAPNELTPGIPKSEYEHRRSQLMDNLPDDSLVVCLGGTIKYMSQGVYKFRQASDFWYLTGFQEADAALILEKTSGRAGRPYRMTLFCRGKNARREQWDGARTGFDDVVSIFSADEACWILLILPNSHLTDIPQALDSSRFYSHLKSLMPRYSHYFFSPSPSSQSQSRRHKRKRTIVEYIAPSNVGSTFTLQEACDAVIDESSGARIRELPREVARLRCIKSTNEQAVMRNAADASGMAHAKTMRFANTRPNTPESSIAAHFEYLCLLSGAERMAYVPVVASGSNALVIHYTSNDSLVQEGDLVLVDAGCEFNGYASDITRTYPTFPTGRFTTAQAEIYNAVLSTLKYCTVLCTESSGLNLYELHTESCRMLSLELNRLGFNLRECSAGPGHSEVEKILYPHFLSHPVGIDLHEAFINRSSPLQSGMVITVEPGVYVPESPAFPKQYHNIGIRIEDEVLIQKDHPIVLSVNAPKEIADVEAACQGLLGLEPF
ncbi:peptidase M24 [Hysterangium stoloniferum]|nr:peptidase M24 [Hysterangium stoloniferum]